MLMNNLPSAKRVAILATLCEGNSMRATSRMADVSINTVTKLLEDAGEACAAHHDDTVRGVKAKRVQCDEIWSLCYTKAKNVETAKDESEAAGDIAHMVGLYTCWYNFVRIHKAHHVTPAMSAGLSDRLWSLEDVVVLLDASEAPAALCGPYMPRQPKAAA
jgi:lambda repressor-like predicted transcriptional regulator